MKKLLLLAFTLLCSQVLVAQTGVITGKILDIKTKQPLLGVSVVVLEKNIGAPTDENGIYRITNVPEDIYKLKISYVGYKTYIETDVRVTRDKSTYVKEIELEEAPVVGNEVEVVAGMFKDSRESPVSAFSFDKEEIRRAPGAAGDIFRALETIPGVSSSGGEFSSFSVRSGTPRQNIILIDNIPFTNISHFVESSGDNEIQGGRFSIFTSGLVEKAKFQAGGFNAKFGGKLASALDLSIKEGNRESFRIDGTYDLMGWETNYDGPSFIDKSTSIVFSARSQDFKRILEVMNVLDEGHPSFSDYLLKITSDIHPNHKISLLALYATEKFQRTTEHFLKDPSLENTALTKQVEDKILTGINWRWLTNKNSFLQTSVYYNQINRSDDYGRAIADPINGAPPTLNNVRSRFPIQVSRADNYVLGLKSDFTYLFSKELTLNAGIQYQNNKRKYNFIQNGTDTLYVFESSDLMLGGGNNFLVYDPKFLNYSYDGARSETSVYFETSFVPHEKFTLNPGIRLDYDNLSKLSYFSPRISGSYQLNPALHINLAAGIYYQLPEIEYVTIDRNNLSLKNEKSFQTILGITNYLSDDIKLSIETYYKDLSRIIVRPFRDRNEMTNSGKGYAYGIDFGLLKRFTDKYYGQINYSYSQAKQKDNDAGKYYFSPFSQPHIFNILVGYQLNDSWSFSAKWKYATGRPKNEYIIHADVLKNPAMMRYSEEITSKYSSRLNDYHSLNFRVDYRRQFAKHFALVAYIDILNLYDRKNAVSENFIPEKGKVKTAGMAMLPTIGFKLEI